MIHLYGPLLVLGLFISLYFWWKMGREEHFDEISLFDGFFSSVFIYFLLGRIGYVATHFSELGTLYRSLAIIAYPGLNELTGVVAVIVFIILFARYQKWDVWKALDNTAVALPIVFVFGSLGTLLNNLSQNWKAELLPLVLSFVIFLVVTPVRKNFRFYAWYKGESSVAQEGLAALIFGILASIYLGLYGIPLALLCMYLIYRRVGRHNTTIWDKIISTIRRK